MAGLPLMIFPSSDEEEEIRSHVVIVSDPIVPCEELLLGSRDLYTTAKHEAKEQTNTYYG